VKLIHQKEAELVRKEKMPDAGLLHVAQEGFFGMQMVSYYRRFPRIAQFQAALAATKKN